MCCRSWVEGQTQERPRGDEHQEGVMLFSEEVL